jgi:dihydrofolate synthase/folylpolyglutamate synthase
MNKGSLEQWLQRLETLHPSEMELGLERVSVVAERLELLSPLAPVVTVAGSNGKGSTVAVLEALLLEAGRRTGSFTSPHFLRFNERIRVAGEEAKDIEIVAAFAAIDDARQDISLTYFEFATLAALWIFRDRGVDVILLEVGLGGRLDATNIIDPSVAVVTQIALDHQQWLGETLGEIALEKAGILRADRPLVIADASPPPELLERADSLGAAPILLYGRDFAETGGAQKGGLQVRQCDGRLLDLPAPERVDLLPENVGAATQAACLLGVAPDANQFRQALSRLRATGRREARQVAGLDYILDVAHNPASVTKLLEFISDSQCKGRNLAVFSAMADKDIRGMLTPAVGVFDAWFLADQPDNPRAETAAATADALRSLGETMISVSKNLRQAFRRAQSLMAVGDRLVIFGSFYTVAAVLPLLEKDHNKSLAGAVS